MNYKLLLLLLSCVTLHARFSLNPFKQIENAERNRADFFNGLRSLFGGFQGNPNPDEDHAYYGDGGSDSNGNPRPPRYFKEIAGKPPQDFIDLADYLKNPKKYREAGIRPFKGILLVGPPGSGKTSLVRALAHDTGCELISSSGSEFGAVFKGVGMLQIKSMFGRAREVARETGKPVIIFIDDFDAIGSRNDYRADPQTIGELLNQLDGYEQNDSFIVVAATNNPEQIDEALKRPGRFDKVIEIGFPDQEKRYEILLFYTSSRKLDDDIDLTVFAEATQNFSPADLKIMVESAQMEAVRSGGKIITYEHLKNALEQTAKSITLRGDKKHRLKTIRLDKEQPHGFELLAGEINQDITDLVLQLRHPERFKKLGIERPRGFLFVGPPGTGKTSLARAIADETDCDFISVSASEFIELYVGVGAQRVRELFDQARKRAQHNGNKTTIIFIDDLDAIGKRSSFAGDTETQRTLVELLNQLDGFNRDENIVVIGATNNPQGIDSALKRPGRFEVIIEVPMPDENKRHDILQFYAKERPVDPALNVRFYAMKTRNFSPADLRMMVNQAAKFALREGAETITSVHFDKALEFMARRRQLAQEEYLGS